MDWVQARRKLINIATGKIDARALQPEDTEAPSGEPPSGEPIDPGEPGGDREPSDGGPEESPDRLVTTRAASLCVASGKGGTGKTVVTASLAHLFSKRGRTLILDADLGVGNAHILQDVSPERTFVDVVEGSQTVRDVLLPCGGQVDLLAAGSGVPRMADLSGYEMRLIAAGLEDLEQEYRFVLVDSAAGVSRQTMTFAEASDVVLVVTTPDLTAMTDAYAFLKVLYGRRPGARALIVVNRSHDEEEALRVYERISDVCSRFLGQAPAMIGWVPDDRAVTRAVNRRTSVVALDPKTEAARSMRILAVRVLEELGRDHSRGLGRTLLKRVGYTSRLS